MNNSRIFLIVLFIIFSFAIIGCSGTASVPKAKTFTIAVSGENGESYRSLVTIVKNDGTRTTRTDVGKFEKDQPKYLIYNEEAKSVSVSATKANNSNNTLSLYMLDSNDKILKTESTSAPFGQVAISAQ